MASTYRVYPNRMGSDPARMAEATEPQYGYGPGYRYYPPSPKGAELLEECVSFAFFWKNSLDHAADRRWRRRDALRQHRNNLAHLRALNIQLLREYLGCLKGVHRMRAFRTIANLKAQQ
ncbi:MAG: hypothetical protein ACYC9K_01005 [Sulfuricaulis sp.]